MAHRIKPDKKQRRTRDQVGSTPIIPGAVAVVISGLALLASLWGALPFLIFAIALLAMAAVELAVIVFRRELAVRPELAALAGGGFPLVAAGWGEGGLGVGAGLFSMLVLGLAVFRGVKPRALEATSVTLLASLYCGLLGSYLVLLRDLPTGHRLVLGLVITVGVFHVGRSLLSRRFTGKGIVGSIPNSLDWFGAAGGTVACLLGALLTSLFVPLAFGGALFFGLVVAAACVIGDLASNLMLSQLGVTERESWVPGLGGLVARLSTTLVAAPAAYYVLKLYLF